MPVKRLQTGHLPKTLMKTSVSCTWKSLIITLACATLLAAPSVAKAASGKIYMFTQNPSLEAGTSNFGGFLRSLGYTVTVEQNAGANAYEILDVIGSTNQPLQAQLISELTNYDLIIIHRNYGSGTLNSSTNEMAIWNMMNVPILCCNAPYARSNRWRWINSNASGTLFGANKDLTWVDSNHPIVAGLNTDLFVTNGVIYAGVFNSDVSTAPDGGTNMVAIALTTVSGANSLCLAVWDENGGQVRGFFDAGGQTYIRRRVFFEMPEYRNGGTWGEISWNGNRMWANAVAYAMTGQVPPAPPAIGNFNPADGSLYNTAATTFTFQTTSSQPIPLNGIQVIVNGQDVSGSLQFAGSTTSRDVSYPGLVPNQLYNISISVSNVFGVNLASLQFDTFDAGAVQIVYPDFDNNFTGTCTTNAYQIYMQVQSTAAQVVSLAQSNASELPPATRLKGVFYLPGSTTAPQFVALTDAFSNRRVLRLPSDTITFTPSAMSGVTVSGLYLVPVSNPPSTILPALGQASPYPGQTAVSPLAALALDLIDGDNPVVPGSVQLFVDSANVTASPQTTVADTISGARAQYTPPNFLAPGQAHTVKLIFADNAAHNATNQYTFNTAPMPALTSSMMIPVNMAVTPGFNILISVAPSNTDNVFTNFSSRAELQLAGQLVGPSGPVTNAISGTTSPSWYQETNVINYSYDGNPTGLFTNNEAFFPFGATVPTLNMAVAATTYLQLPAGIVTFGVDSAAGFLFTGGYDGSVVLGVYEGGRGNQVPSEFPVLVYQAGLYPVRLLHYAAGGASLELYTLGNAAAAMDGRVLVNGIDDNSAVPVHAYAGVKPTLSVVKSGGLLIVSWYGGGNFQLKQSSLLTPGSWTPVGQQPVIQGWLHTVSLPLPTSGNQFYRLELQP
jgi:hypothetical protein